MPHPRATRRPDSPSLIPSIDSYSGRILQPALIESEAYRFIVEMMSDGAVILSAAGAIAYSNRSFSLMIGLPSEELTGSDMRRFVVAEDLERFNGVMFEGDDGQIFVNRGGIYGVAVDEAVFVAAFFSWVADRPSLRIAVTTATAACVALSIVQMSQYWLGVLPITGLTWARYREVFLHFR